MQARTAPREEVEASKLIHNLRTNSNLKRLNRHYEGAEERRNESVVGTGSRPSGPNITSSTVRSARFATAELTVTEQQPVQTFRLSPLCRVPYIRFASTLKEGRVMRTVEVEPSAAGVICEGRCGAG